MGEVNRGKRGGILDMNQTYLQRTMRRVIGAAAVAMILGAGTAYAKNLNVYTWIQVNAPVETVWAEIGDFCDVAKILPTIIVDCVLTTGKGVGSIRYLTFEDGMKVDEPMANQGPSEYTYIMSKGFLTDSRYRSTLRAYPATDPGTSVVEWLGQIDADAFEDGGTEISETLRTIYQLGLDNIKKMFE
jgi:hypothetical protein